jgi:hypothetical protein
MGIIKCHMNNLLLLKQWMIDGTREPKWGIQDKWAIVWFLVTKSLH